MKINVNIWYVTESDNLPILKTYEISEDVNNISEYVLDMIIKEPDFCDKESLTVQIVE